MINCGTLPNEKTNKTKRTLANSLRALPKWHVMTNSTERSINFGSEKGKKKSDKLYFTHVTTLHITLPKTKGINQPRQVQSSQYRFFFPSKANSVVSLKNQFKNPITYDHPDACIKAKRRHFLWALSSMSGSLLYTLTMK